MILTCPISSLNFEVSKEDLEFYSRLELPPPTLHPTERLRRRMALRNFRNLFKSKCDISGEGLISMYPERVPFPVYSNEYWWSDQWDPLSYGRDYDFSRPFFEQVKDLANIVPRFPVSNVQAENCSYSNMVKESNNCYLVFGCVGNEDCLYGHIVWYSDNCLDCLYAYRSQWCAHSTDIVGCYQTHYSLECFNCRDCFFLRDSKNCKNCFGSTNLRNAEYVFFNEQLTKEQYEEKIKELVPFTRTDANKISRDLAKKNDKNTIYPPAYGNNFENCIGNHFFDCADAFYSFDCKSCESIKFCNTVFQLDNCYDCTFTGSGMAHCIETLTCPGSIETHYSHLADSCSNVFYSEFCFSSANLFGCNGLKQKQYCIFNKQYSKAEYEELVPRIISHAKATGEWGEFFPIGHSPFTYNESIASEYLPLSKQEVQQVGGSWSEAENSTQKNDPISPPESIEDTDDSVLEKTFFCNNTGKAFKIIKPELDLYRRLKLPLPDCAPDERHLNRMSLRTTSEVFKGVCPVNGSEFDSAFDPEKYLVYSHAAYLEQLHNE